MKRIVGANNMTPQMKMRPLFAWYDMWVGAFWDRKSRKLYILPVPCLGVVIEFPQQTTEKDG